MKESWEVKRLGEVCEIKPPKKQARDRLNDDDFVSFVPMEDLGVLTKNFIATKERPLKEVCGSYTYFSDNDVLLAKITPCFENGKIGIAQNLKNGIGFGSSEYIVFRSRSELIPDYLYYFLTRDQFRQDGKKGFRCKKSGYFTKPVKNITNGIFICHKQVNNDTKSNSYSLKRQ